MSHFSDVERAHIIMERERDGKRLETIARQHKCTSAIISKTISHYNRTGKISGDKSTGRPHTWNRTGKPVPDRPVCRLPVRSGHTFKTGKNRCRPV